MMSQLVAKHRWLPFIVPFAVYLTLGQFEPQPRLAGGAAARSSGEPQRQTGEAGLAEPPSWGAYPTFYALRIAITVAAVLLFSPSYLSFPLRVHPGSFVLGAVGVIVWIGLCWPDWEVSLSRRLGLTVFGGRPSFDPITALGASPLLLGAFLTVRFTGLCLVVPLIEEFFLRGFLMRYFYDLDRADWWEIPIGAVTPLAVAVVVGTAVLSHPTEAAAAACWFSLVTWWTWRRRNIWDAVAVHAVTNLLLGLYVLTSRDWTLW